MRQWAGCSARIGGRCRKPCSAFNDLLAPPARCAVLRENGIQSTRGRSPSQGIDDLAQSAFVDPPLTSLAPDLDEIAESARYRRSSCRLKAGQGGRTEYRRKLTSFELKVRESTRCTDADNIKTALST